MIKMMKPRIATMDTRRVKPLPKKKDRLYEAVEWRALVKQLIAMRGRRCQQCGATDCRILADHIIEVRDGGPQLDASNVQLLCAQCHGKKTVAARARRATT